MVLYLVAWAIVPGEDAAEADKAGIDQPPMVGHLIMGGGSSGGVNQRVPVAMDAALARGP